ncbi:exopolysaccharide biosynthesis protein [Cribrihabitans pelagius]|uniref:exopolysaccharide biosynthesis protein n=1 Tax=Cribrihabitans pelagius TaxID=1765746 RepID=UPI003B5BAC60
MQKQTIRSLGDVADQIRSVSGNGHVSIDGLVQALGRRSHQTLLLIVALTAATPLSGIPGLSAVCGLVIALISLEMLLSYREVRLPRKLSRQNVKGQSVERILSKVEPFLRWLDRHTHHRMTGLFHRPLIYIPQVICLLSGLTMPFLEFIPFSGSIVASGVALLAFAMFTRDGLFFLLALLPYTGIAALVLRIL